MVTSPPVVGNITAQDDYTHPLGSETNFNESVSEIPDRGDLQLFSTEYLRSIQGTYCP